MKRATRYFYNLWDMRYLTDPDDAMIYETFESLKEARNARKEYGDTVLVKSIQSLQDGTWVETSSQIMDQ